MTNALRYNRIRRKLFRDFVARPRAMYENATELRKNQVTRDESTTIN